MKGYTLEEFSGYMKGLKFEDLEDMAMFIKEYFDYYKSVPDTNVEEKELALGKYAMLISEYGMLFVSFSLSVIEMRKKLQAEIAAEAAGASA